MTEGHRTSRINHDARSGSRQATSRSQERGEGHSERGRSRKGVGVVGRSLDQAMSSSRNSERSQVLSVLRAASSETAQGKVLSVLRSPSREAGGSAEGGGRPITSKSVNFQ
jgi:hypothetical protein